jgi:small subunit ribosomal protein S8
MLNDPLANVLSKINNAEKRSKSICTVAPVSKMIETILQLMNENGMIGSFEVTNDGKGKFAVVNLIGKINNCGAIKPRYAVKNFNFEKYQHPRE